MRVRFDEVFNVVDGKINPKGTVKIGGVTMSPGASVGANVKVAGVDLSQCVGKDLDIERHPDGTIEIKGTFQ